MCKTGDICELCMTNDLSVRSVLKGTSARLMGNMFEK